jgi:hypothetical protein
MTLGEEFSSKPALVNTVVKAARSSTNYIGQRGGLSPYVRLAGSPFGTKLCTSGTRRLYKLFGTQIRLKSEDGSGPGTNLPVAAGWVVKDFRSMLTCTSGKILTFNQSFCLGGVLPAGGFRSS